MSDTDFDSAMKELDKKINSKIKELNGKINNIKKNHKNIIIFNIDIFNDEIKNIKTINDEINKEIDTIKSKKNNSQTQGSSKTESYK
jgi:hypothetical protein